MTDIILVPAHITSCIYHFGIDAGYACLNNSYFINEVLNINDTNIFKHVILDVSYNPDNTYKYTDGHAGRCWLFKINDCENDKIIQYSIRNWVDLVEYFREKRLIFVK